jgi:hypothetical protein
LTGLKLGYLLNFGEALMKDGITRTINGNLCTTSVSPCLREKPKIEQAGASDGA